MSGIEGLLEFYSQPVAEIEASPAVAEMHEELLRALESGAVRAAEADADGAWQPVTWVKQAILTGFRCTQMAEVEGFGAPALDKTAYPPRRFGLEEGVRFVPGGTAVRRGAHVARGVVIMPPAYINVGAWVGEGTMVDSHALVGSCAQVGARVHLSAGAQIGGVLEPAGARPVVVEDDAFLGALTGVFEGVVVRERAVLASGVLLTASTVVHDLVQERTWRGEIPAGAVVIPGTRPASGTYAKEHGLQLSTPLIVKYRDARTAAATALESSLR